MGFDLASVSYTYKPNLNYFVVLISSVNPFHVQHHWLYFSSFIINNLITPLRSSIRSTFPFINTGNGKLDDLKYVQMFVLAKIFIASPAYTF
jgi:hypothetical protein